MNVKYVAVSTASSALVTGAVSGSEKGSKQWLKASDALYADGVRPDMLTGNGKLVDIQEPVKASIILGFTVAERKLINGEPKAMSQEQKDARKVVQQKMGRYIALIQKYLTDLMVANGEIEETEDQEKTPTDKLKIVLETALKIVQGDEKAEGYDPVIMAKLIGQAIAIIK
jgi:hypothetical protein